MEKRSKVLVAAFNREWTGKYGVMYDHTITFENQDTGSYSSKAMNQDKFVVGVETDYLYDNSNPEFPAKIKPVSTFVQGGGNNGQAAEPGRQQSIERQQALKFALESYDIEKHGLTTVFTLADKFVEYLGGTWKTMLPPQQPDIDTTQAVTESGLPF